MKNCRSFLLIACFLLSTSAQAQEVDQVLEKYRAAIAKIQTVHCQVEQLDTFVTGHVWHHIGQLSMLRAPADSLFGFQFKAAKDVGGEALYDGLSSFEIDHKKESYEVNPKPEKYILGSPGGQLVVEEMMADQSLKNRPTLIDTEEFFVLRYSFPDLEEYDVRQREKKIFLHKTTFLPAKVINRQVSLGKKQVLTRIISNVQLNRPQDRNAFQKDFLSSYALEVEESYENIHEDLLQTQVKDFQLETFTGQRVSTRPQKSKVLLLDFWEVWCGPCVQSMPKVQELANKYEGEGLAVVGVLMDKNSQDSAEKLITKKGFEFTQAIGGKDIREYFKVYAIPQYVLIDQSGTIQHIYRGYDDDIEKRIKVLLADAK